MEDAADLRSPMIRDMPFHLRPREKLAQLGPAALDNAELMALFIGSGFRGRSAIDVGRDLLTRFGSLAALGGLPLNELAREKGMGMAKASKLAAAFELGTRVAREQVRQLPLDCPERIHELFAPQMQHLSQEQVFVATLDSRLCHTSTTLVSMGTVNETSAHPREVLRPVITRGAYGFVLVHNHPSGDPSPSSADTTITQRLVAAAKIMQLRFLDHLIIGRPSLGREAYFSFREAGIVQ